MYGLPERNLAQLPKAHLHLHLDGAMRRSTLAELAAERGLEAPIPAGYGSFAAFGDTILAAARVLDDASVVERVVDEIVADAANEGVVWIELSAWPGLFCGRLGSDLEAVDVLLRSGRLASAMHGVGFGLIVAANCDRGPAEALSVARIAVQRADAGVVGLGLDGDEAAHPPGQFAAAFDVAREAALKCVPHAGELAGPASIVDALELLHADRIMHGVRAVEDPCLLARLAEGEVCLDVCPTSNVLLSISASLAEHPLPTLLASGVPCSLNADDPLLFDCSALSEYERCRHGLGLSDIQLADIARESIHASAASTVLVQAGLQGIDEWLASPSSGDLK